MNSLVILCSLVVLFGSYTLVQALGPYALVSAKFFNKTNGYYKVITRTTHSNIQMYINEGNKESKIVAVDLETEENDEENLTIVEYSIMIGEYVNIDDSNKHVEIGFQNLKDTQALYDSLNDKQNIEKQSYSISLIETEVGLNIENAKMSLQKLSDTKYRFLIRQNEDNALIMILTTGSFQITEINKHGKVTLLIINMHNFKIKFSIQFDKPEGAKSYDKLRAIKILKQYG